MMMKDTLMSQTQNPLSIAYATYSDMHKEAYGFRPRNVDTSNWSLADFEVQCEALYKLIEAQIEHERLAHAEAITKFENHVTSVISIGAGDRATALRWIMEASDANNDWYHLAYINRLPHDYFTK